MTAMKRIILSLILAFTWMLSSAQCSFAVNGFDQFDNTRIIELKPEKIMYPVLSGITTWFALSRKADQCYLTVKFNYPDPICLVSSSHLLIRLENNDVVKLDHDRPMRCSSLEDGIFHDEFRFLIEVEDIGRLGASPVVAIRIEAAETNIDIDITKGNANKKIGCNYFFNNFRCLLSN